MEKPQNFESNEQRIERLITELAEVEGMAVEDIHCDLMVFAEVEGNDSANPAYIEEVAEKLGITTQELNEYVELKIQNQDE